MKRQMVQNISHHPLFFCPCNISSFGADVRNVRILLKVVAVPSASWTHCCPTKTWAQGLGPSISHPPVNIFPQRWQVSRCAIRPGVVYAALFCQDCSCAALPPGPQWPSWPASSVSGAAAWKAAADWRLFPLFCFIILSSSPILIWASRIGDGGLAALELCDLDRMWNLCSAWERSCPRRHPDLIEAALTWRRRTNTGPALVGTLGVWWAEPKIVGSWTSPS